MALEQSLTIPSYYIYTLYVNPILKEKAPVNCLPQAPIVQVFNTASVYSNYQTVSSV